MRKKTILTIGPPLAAALLGIAAYLLLRTRGTDFARLRRGRDFNVILVTLDTTRADRLGCYGFNAVDTPVIDGFAARGIRFDRCFSTTPLTFPAHTTILTGTLPPFHGVRDNGGFVVPPGIRTMAEVFKDRGYATSAFIAAYVLDSQWGLDRGFDTYFDNFDLSKFEKISLGTVQRPADQVLDQALPWIESHKDGKFFAWIHLYDPHTPYEPPPPFDKRYASRPYVGEIAFMDSQLGRLRDLLEKDGLAETSFLVLAGDHGESLGEHDEQSHGFFVYQAAIHVPLIFVTPFSRLEGRTSSRVVSLADILPTVCAMTGLAAPPQVQGANLVPAFEGRNGSGPPIAYSETYYPRFHYGWSELRAVQNDRYKLILAPVPELYDVVQDPGEEKNLVYLDKAAYAALSAEAERFIERSEKNAYKVDMGKVDEETREKLAALGYLGSFMDASRVKGDRPGNPREKIGVFNDLNRAREMGMAGRPDEGIAVIKEIIASDPEIPDAYFTLGNIYYKIRRFPEAVDAFRRVLERKPDDAFAVINIANSYGAMRKFDEAESFVLDHIRKGFPDPQLYYLLGSLSVRRRDFVKAAGYFRECLARNAESAASHNSLGAIGIETGDPAGAEEHIRAALAIHPELAGAHFNLAQVHEALGRIREAEAAYIEELRISPSHFKSMYNLARLYRLQGNESAELAYLEKCVATDPEFPLSYFYLARIHLNRGEKLEEAVALVRKGIALDPGKADLPLGYFLLADLYNRLGRTDEAEANARKGRELAASR